MITRKSRMFFVCLALIAFTGTALHALGGLTQNLENTPPDAVDDDVITMQNTVVTIDVLANDTDADGDALRIVSVGVPLHGVVTFTDGVVCYVPDYGYEGMDSFPYTIEDGQGGTDTAMVYITVLPSPGIPNAVELLEDGQVVTVDGYLGIVTVGAPEFDLEGA